jgi:hypothetical protein
MVRVSVERSGHQGCRVADDHELPLTTEAFPKQFVGFLGDAFAITRGDREEGRQPRALADELQVPADLRQGLWHLVLRKVLDQAK